MIKQYELEREPFVARLKLNITEDEKGMLVNAEIYRK